MRNALIATAAMLAGVVSAQAAPQAAPPGLPTVSAGPAVVQPTFGYGFPSHYRGYGGYRVGSDGRFHGYGVYGPRRDTGAAQARPSAQAADPAAARNSAIALNGEVLASSIIANQYAPLYGVLNVGYGGYDGYGGHGY